MRTVYHEKLSELSEQLGRMCGLVASHFRCKCGLM
jgi:hypothetical protein